MRFFIIISLLSIYALGINIYTMKDVKIQIDKEDVILMFDKKTQEPINGILKIFDKSGALKANIPYKNGKIDGIKKDYYESGKLKNETSYKDGKENGVAKGYTETGILKAEVPYEDGNINGHIKWYFETGELEREMSYKDGIKDGVDKEYYKTGALRFLTPYKKGKVEGLKKWYYMTGELKSEILMKDGEAAGLLKLYEKNGDLKYEGLGKVHAEDLNTPTAIKLAKDYPVTEKKCQIEHESVLKVMFARHLNDATPSFPEEGVVKFDYNVTSKYKYQPEFKVRVIHFMFKDSEVCNKFLDDFDAKTDYTAYNKCKAKAHTEYRAIKDKPSNKTVLDRAYNIYLMKTKQCEWLIEYP